MTCRRYIFIYLSLITFLMQTPAWGSTPWNLFDKGLEAFHKQDYAEALRYFEQARSEGLDDARLYYNLGVTYYKLGRYRDAEEVFLIVKKEPAMKSLATYNLGLVALKQHNRQQAENWFRETLAADKSGKLASLSAEQLRRLGYAVQIPQQTEYPGFAMIRGAMGYDDNVILQASDLTLSATDQNDTFFEFFAFANKQVARLGNKTLELEGSLYNTRYVDLSANDLDDLNLGIVLAGNFEQWEWDTGLSTGATYIDGNGLNSTTTIRLVARRKLSETNDLRLQYQLGRIDEIDEIYSYLAGWRHQAQVDSTWKLGKQQVRITYRFEFNDRKDLQTPLFTSYSPARHNLRIRNVYAITKRLNTSLDLRYRYSRYNDPNEQLDGSFVTRTDTRYRAIASVSYHVGKNTNLRGEYAFTKNDSNLSDREYTRNRFQISLDYLW